MRELKGWLSTVGFDTSSDCWTAKRAAGFQAYRRSSEKDSGWERRFANCVWSIWRTR